MRQYEKPSFFAHKERILAAEPLTGQHVVECDACMQEFEGRWQDWTFEGSWQESYLAAAVPSYKRGVRKPRPVAGLYSDFLYQPWLCTAVAIDPAWLEVENIDRRAGLSLEEFREKYERPNRPVIITDLVGLGFQERGRASRAAGLAGCQ
jgi:hypothetical protein